MYIICPKLENEKDEIRVKRILNKVLKEYENEPFKIIRTIKDFKETNLQNSKLLFVIALSFGGINIEYCKILEYIRNEKEFLKNSIAGLIIDGKSEFYTKDVSRNLVFSANMSGCTFIGKPLVEATGDLKNFKTISKLEEISLEEAYEKQVKSLIDRLFAYKKKKLDKANLLLVHSSNRATSNTLMLWDMVSKYLDDRFEINEVALNKVQLNDCRGCPYEACLHFGKQVGCFYGGGVVTEEVYPALLEADVVVMVCPNYNDSLNANLVAVINRLTALSISHNITDKSVYAIVVSGYSGGDIIAKQILGALNLNKGMELKENFAFLETANAKGSILKVEDIEIKAKKFADKINGNLEQ